MSATAFHNPLHMGNHSSKYEEAIRLKCNKWCASCERFLFPEQVRKLKRGIGLPQWSGISDSKVPNFCFTCSTTISKGTMPSIAAVPNNLHVNDPPAVLLDLNKLERRLLCKIQVFMTMIILPGGQYAERGLVLNLPVNHDSVVQQLRCMNSSMFCTVKFVAGLPRQGSVRHLIRPQAVLKAFDWLCANNKLFSQNTVIPQLNVPHNVCTNHESNSENMDDVDLEELEESSMIPVNYTSNLRPESTEYPIVEVPRSKEQPVSIYETESGEESAFPWLFPNGVNGYLENRPQKVQRSMYFRLRLYNYKGFWRKDISYLLHAAASYDLSMLKSEIGTFLRMTCSNREGLHDVPITAAYICRNQRDPHFLKNSYMFMKNIRGTVAYFKNCLHDLLAMVRTLGPPTLFITLSADDLHWPELGMLLEDIDYETAAEKSSFLHSMRNDPFLTATHFERRFDALINHVIKGPLKPLGDVLDYFYRVEFQNRGSAHYHMFFWIKDVPQIVTLENEHEVIKYIDRTISTKLPKESADSELFHFVSRLQIHQHSRYCQRGKTKHCRFKFPQAVCAKTHIHSNLNIIQKKGRYYETERNSSSAFVNPYNPTILKHFRSNMDIQLVNNAESIVYYICAYVCKSEPDELRNALGNLITSVFPSQQSLTPYQKLWKIGTTVLKHRRLSAQEAAFRMSNLKMVQSTRTCVYLNARKPMHRFKMLKRMAELEQLEPNSTDIFHNNLLDYYCARPPELSFCSLYYFAAWYQLSTKPKGTRKSELPRIYISKYNKWFHKRKKMAVVRYPNFAVHSEDYYYSLLLLLLPHSCESELLDGYGTAEDAFFHKQHLLNRSIDYTYFSFTDDIENAVRRINFFREDITATANMLREQNSASIVVNDLDINDIIGNTTDATNTSCGKGIDDGSIEQQRGRESAGHQGIHDVGDDNYISHDLYCHKSKEEIRKDKSKLTNSQKRVFDYVESWFNTESSEKTSLCIFISGAGGVGKSFLIELIIAWINQYHYIIPGTMAVAVSAPTGTAARNVKGETIHTLLKIPVTKHTDYLPLHPHTLQLLRSRFSGVHTIVIDEISMVSDGMLTIISRRLSEISDCSSAFGGFNIIVVGDLFQLRPVLGHAVYTNTGLWYLFQPFFLRENVRQIADTEYANLLNRARYGILLPKDIDTLKSRLIDISTDDVADALHVYPTRKEVEEYNKLRQSQLNSDIVTISADHFFSSQDTTPGGEVSECYIPADDRKAGNLPTILHLSLGSRVMLIRNIMTSSGLVNGAMGLVSGFHYQGSQVVCIQVLFDDPMIGRLQQNKGVSHEPIDIELFDHTYLLYGRKIVRRSFPLIPCWACTIHKVQGMTFGRIVVDIGSSVFESGMAYVALSRVQTLDGLYITKFHVKSVKANAQTIKENDRLMKLELKH